MHINDHNPLLPYLPASDRYDSMKYRYCGNSGIQLPEISLGRYGFEVLDFYFLTIVVKDTSSKPMCGLSSLSVGLKSSV
jgi:hypothetical protein